MMHIKTYESARSNLWREVNMVEHEELGPTQNVEEAISPKEAGRIINARFSPLADSGHFLYSEAAEYGRPPSRAIVREHILNRLGEGGPVFQEMIKRHRVCPLFPYHGSDLHTNKKPQAVTKQIVMLSYLTDEPMVVSHYNWVQEVEIQVTRGRDDWFFVQTEHHSSGVRGRPKEAYYICDCIEGVLSLFANLNARDIQWARKAKGRKGMCRRRGG
jgi:hypothetical protein